MHRHRPDGTDGSRPVDSTVAVRCYLVEEIGDSLGFAEARQERAVNSCWVVAVRQSVWCDRSARGRHRASRKSCAGTMARRER